MKRVFLILMSLSMSLFVMAQENTKQKELGLTFINLDSFGVTYRTGTDKALWRFNALAGSGANSESEIDTSINTNSYFAGSIGIGREYRKNISDKLEFRFGADLSFGYSQQKIDVDDDLASSYNNDRESISYTPSINLILGFNYLINENLVLGVEMLPYFRYSIGTDSEKINLDGDIEETKTTNFYYGISNSSVLLSLAYRF